MIVVPLRTGAGLNDRGHHQAKARRVKAERRAVAWALLADRSAVPTLPCVVTLTRLAPSSGLDDDNLAGALKGVRDQIAEWLGVDDRQRDVVRYEYRQQRAKAWGVRIEFGAMERLSMAVSDTKWIRAGGVG